MWRTLDAQHLLELTKAKAELTKLREIVGRLRKTEDGVPMTPGGTYWAWCRDHYADDDTPHELLAVIWWQEKENDCFNPEFTLADWADEYRLRWEFFVVRGVYSTEAAARAAILSKKENNDERSNDR